MMRLTFASSGGTTNPRFIPDTNTQTVPTTSLSNETKQEIEAAKTLTQERLNNARRLRNELITQLDNYPNNHQAVDHLADTRARIRELKAELKRLSSDTALVASSSNNHNGGDSFSRQNSH